MGTGDPGRIEAGPPGVQPAADHGNTGRPPEAALMGIALSSLCQSGGGPRGFSAILAQKRTEIVGFRGMEVAPSRRSDEAGLSARPSKKPDEVEIKEQSWER